MKIILVNFHNLWGMGEYCHKALVKLGHQVNLFYTNSGGSYFEHILNRTRNLKFKDDRFTKLWEKKINERFFRAVDVFKPEIILIIKGDEMLPEVLREVKYKYKVILINWLPDNPFYSRLKNILEAISIYDYIFTFDPAHISQLKKYAKGEVNFLPLCCEPEMHRKINLTEEEKKEYSYDICFIGSAFPERVEILKSILDYNLAVWGEGWRKERFWLKECYKGRASGEKMVKIYNAAKIALNIHHSQTLEGANLRTFEICASGAFQLVDKRASLKQLFQIGNEIVCFNDIKELRELIDYFLNHEQERAAIAENGYKKTHEEHTYLNRLREIFSVISK